MTKTKTRIKKIFQQHIKSGGIISSPDKLIDSLIEALDKPGNKVGVYMWVVNNEFYYTSKPEAVAEMMEGDSLSREYHEADSLRKLVCALLNHEPTMVDEEIIVRGKS